MKKQTEVVLSDTELYNDILNKFKSFFEDASPSFSNLIWQIVVNKRFKDKSICFTSVISRIKDRNCFEIGIAESDESGYYPTHVGFLPKLNYNTCMDLCLELNEILFNLLPQNSWDIILSSMNKSK